MKKNKHTNKILKSFAAFFMALLLMQVNTAQSASRKEIIVVIPIAAKSLNPEMRNIIESAFIGELIQNGTYEITSGETVTNTLQAAFDEYAKKNKGKECNEIACIREAVNSLGTDLVLKTAIALEGGTYFLSAKVENVTTGSQLFHADIDCEECKIAQLKQKVKMLAGELLSSTSKKSAPIFEPTTEIPTGGASGITEIIKPSNGQNASSGSGGIYITTAPKGAEVYFGDILAGSTNPAFQKMNLKTGESLKITLKKAEYHDYSFSARISTGITKYEDLKLKPAFGYLSINGSPEEAEVYLGGNLIGKLPIKGEKIKSGKHLLMVSKKLYETQSDRVIEIKDAETLTQKIRLTEAFGTLNIESAPKGTEVFIETEKIGVTPIKAYKQTPGAYKLKLTKQGYETKEYDLTNSKRSGNNLNRVSGNTSSKSLYPPNILRPAEPRC